MFARLQQALNHVSIIRDTQDLQLGQLLGLLATLLRPVDCCTPRLVCLIPVTTIRISIPTPLANKVSTVTEYMHEHRQQSIIYSGISIILRLTHQTGWLADALCYFYQSIRLFVPNGIKRSTLGIKRSKVKVTRGRRQICMPV